MVRISSSRGASAASRAAHALTPYQLFDHEKGVWMAR